MILGIESSSRGCSIALFHEGSLVGSIENREEKSAASGLTTMIKNLCDQHAVKFTDLEAIAVAKGPGSYTGLRVGVSTAKGLCMALNIPLISYNTLDALYEQVKSSDFAFYVPMLDARRLEVYCKIISNGGTVQETEAVIVHADSFQEILEQGRCLFFGDGSEKCIPVLKHPNAFFQDNETMAKSALEIIEIKYAKKEFEDLVLFEPFYLKDYMFKTAASK